LRIFAQIVVHSPSGPNYDDPYREYGMPRNVELPAGSFRAFESAGIFLGRCILEFVRGQR
jgi:hypothetical protein